jgi:hypothetical protein
MSLTPENRDAALTRVSELAGLQSPESLDTSAKLLTSTFKRQIELAIKEANAVFSANSPKVIYAGNVRRSLQRVAEAAKALEAELLDLDKADPEKSAAQVLFWASLAEFDLDEETLIEDYLEHARRMVAAAENSVEKVGAYYQVKGRSPRRHYDRFVYSLLTAALLAGGALRFSTADKILWKGDLIEALGVLRPFLRRNFFGPKPIGTLGRSFQEIRERVYRASRQIRPL